MAETAAYRSGLSVLSPLPRPLRRSTLACPRAPRRRVREHGVIRSELAEAAVTGLNLRLGPYHSAQARSASRLPLKIVIADARRALFMLTPQLTRDDQQRRDCDLPPAKISSPARPPAYQ